MCTFKKAKVVRLSATNDSNIYLKPQDGHLVIVINTKVKRYVTSLNFPKQHLYIISDDEIKEGDWKYDTKLNMVIQHRSYTDGCKKIIATTDSSLGLPYPSQQFIQKYIEEYNKGNVITDVLVEYEYLLDDMVVLPYWKLKVNAKDNTITIKKLKEIYTKEEVCQILEKYTSFIWSEVGIHYPVSLSNNVKDTFINRELK